jgi:hypothetical protein
MEHVVEKKNVPNIPSLMDVDFVPTIPYLIEEVQNFKAFLEGWILEGKDVLVGHTKVQQSNFYLNSIGVSILKYK